MHTTVLIYSVVGGKHKDNPDNDVYIPIHAEAIDKGMKRTQTCIGTPTPIHLLLALRSGNGLELHGVTVSLRE